MKAIIVGGGVSGCTTALFLKKIGIEVVVYEKYPTPPAIQIGASLGLGANGTATLALYSEQLADDIYSRGHKAPFFEMREHDGRHLGYFPAGREGRYGKYGTMFMKRWDVHDAILKEVESLGIQLKYGMKIISVSEDDRCARVEFADGSIEEADFIVGADGAKSIVREYVVPDAKVIYTGYVGTGGFIPKASVNFDVKHFGGLQPGQKPVGAIMTQGPVGFFGFGPIDEKSAEEGGQYGWWSNCPAEEMRGIIGDAFIAVKPDEIIEKLLSIHGSWYVLAVHTLTSLITFTGVNLSRKSLRRRRMKRSS